MPRKFHHEKEIGVYTKKKLRAFHRKHMTQAKVEFKNSMLFSNSLLLTLHFGLLLLGLP